MGQIVTTVCDRHQNEKEEAVETDVPTIRLTLSGGVKEIRVDIEGEFCKHCIDELVEALKPFVEAGRRPGKATSLVVPPPATPPAPADGKRGPGRPRTNPDGPVDARGRTINNPGPYKCEAPDSDDCARKKVGFDTKQGRAAHERGTHRWHRKSEAERRLEGELIDA